MREILVDDFNKFKVEIFKKLEEYKIEEVDTINLDRNFYKTETEHMNACRKYDYLTDKIIEAKKRLLNPKDDGAVGRALEILLSRAFSPKKWVSSQEKIDFMASFTTDEGKIIRRGIECKSGSGAVNNCKGEFMVYVYTTKYPHGKKTSPNFYEFYYLHKPIIVPLKYFVSLVYNNKGWGKPHPHKNSKTTYNIIATKKALREFCENGLPYKKDEIMNADEIYKHYGLTR